jgi:squalene-hopene/tetraprenyl-beta-curcumene cyclase
MERIPVKGVHSFSTHGVRAPSNGLRHDPPVGTQLRPAIDRASEGLLALQKHEGHWVGELQGDVTLESEFIFLLTFLGRERDERVTKAARFILSQQLPDGGWNNYTDGPSELSASVKAYFALKIAGYDPEAPHMRRAAALIRTLGGAASCNSFTKFYLALLGQFPYANCPAVLPEMVLLPRWAYFNIYSMSSWTRTIVVPLSIFYAYKPVRQLPPELGIRELFLLPPETPLWPHPPTRQWLSWTNLFLLADWAAKRLESWGVLTPLRRHGLRRAVQWMFDHFADSGGVGAIFPPIVYTIVCLRCLGHADDSPQMRWAIKQLDDLVIEEGDLLRVQPCFSPVWDTALTLIALGDAGVPADDPAIARAVRWLLNLEVRRPGDWSLANPDLEPGGWFFEYQNGFYPDTDDTAMVLMALSRCGRADRADALPAVGRAIRWLLGMQNRDGGWAAFDRDINRQLLTKVPFADHNAMLDPSCPDITARVLEALGHFGYTVGDPQVDRALVFLERTQDPRGCWIGRWGVNYIYGTWQVLTGLERVGFDMEQPMVRRAVAWLKQVQQPNGGWGETCRSYDDPSLAGQGQPTPSQAGWALLGLLAAGEAHSEAVRAGIDFLLHTQQPDGSWQEDQFTGTGFPKVFYLKYHMYRLYFPLMALARYAAEVGERGQAAGLNGHASAAYARWLNADSRQPLIENS